MILLAKVIKSQLSKYRIRGEWFRPVPKLLDVIRAETKQFRAVELMDVMLGKKLTKQNRRILLTRNLLMGRFSD